MRLKLYCNRYAHFKDALVCSVNCIYRTRCRDFALFYDEHREGVDELVADYFAARRTEDAQASPPPGRALPLAPVAAQSTPAANLRALIHLEVKREMAEATYIWVGSDDRAELLETEEVLQRAERGAKAKHIYKVAQEMELRFQLVPRKRIEKVKRAVAAETERAASRRARSRKTPAAAPSAPVTPLKPAAVLPATESGAAAAPPRRTRARAMKVVGGK